MSLATTTLLSAVIFAAFASAEVPRQCKPRGNEGVTSEVELVAPVEWNADNETYSPARVSVSFSLRDVPNVDDGKQFAAVVFFLHVRWHDYRLSRHFGNCTGVVHADSFTRRFWTPDLYFYRVTRVQLLASEPLKDRFFLLEGANVVASSLMVVRQGCKFDFNRYPFDRQKCHMMLGSKTAPSTDIVFDGGHSQSNPGGMTLVQYEITFGDFPEQMNLFASIGNQTYSRTGFEIHLSRRLFPFVLAFFLPSFLLTSISFISFFIDPEIVPGRMALLITLVLMLINLSNSARAHAPLAELFTAMDLWWGICIAFMSLAILEYAFLLKVKMDLDSAAKTGVAVAVTNKVDRAGGKGNNDFHMGKAERNTELKIIGFKLWAKRIDKRSLGLSIVGYTLVTTGYVVSYWA